MRSGWVRIQLLWDGCGIAWKSNCYYNWILWLFLRRFETLLWNLLYQSNVSHVYEIHEKIFTTKQSEKLFSKYYSNLKKSMESITTILTFYYWFKATEATLGGLNDCFFVIWFNSVLNGFKAWILASETLPLAANTYSWLLCSSLGQNSTVNGTTVSSLESSTLVLSSGSCDILLVIFLVVVEAVAFRCGSHGVIIVVVPIIVG